MNILQLYEEISNSSENYLIPCIYKITNTENGKFYIGQTKSFYNRLHDHIKEVYHQHDVKTEILAINYRQNNKFASLLRRKYYVCKKDMNCVNKLQLEYRNFDLENFEIEIIEKCNPEILEDREYYWAKELKAEESLNGKIYKLSAEKREEKKLRDNRKEFSKEKFEKRNVILTDQQIKVGPNDKFEDIINQRNKITNSQVPCCADCDWVYNGGAKYPKSTYICPDCGLIYEWRRFPCGSEDDESGYFCMWSPINRGRNK